MAKRSTTHNRRTSPEASGRKKNRETAKEYDQGRFFFSQPHRITRQYLDPLSVYEPNPPPENCNTHLFLSAYAIRRDALLSDAYSLLAAFINKGTYDFSAFKELWLEMNFPLIHLLCPTRSMRDKFMFVLYQTFITFLYEDADAKFPGEDTLLNLKLGVVYALYMLYYTQPDFAPSVLILVDANQWEVLNQLLHFFGRQGLSDGVYALGKLKEVKAFGFSLFIDHNPFYYQQSRLGFDGFLPAITDEPRYQKFDAPQESHFHLLEEKLDELEANVATTQIGGFIDESIMSEIQNLELDYENVKSNLVTEKIAPALNGSVANTLVVSDFQLWLAAQRDREVTASSYLRHLVSGHLEFKGSYQQQEMPETNGSASEHVDGAYTSHSELNHATSEVVNDFASLSQYGMEDENEAMALTELESFLRDQLEGMPQASEGVDENAALPEPKSLDGDQADETPNSTASTVYSFDS